MSFKLTIHIHRTRWKSDARRSYKSTLPNNFTTDHNRILSFYAKDILYIYICTQLQRIQDTHINIVIWESTTIYPSQRDLNTIFDKQLSLCHSNDVYTYSITQSEEKNITIYDQRVSIKIREMWLLYVRFI